MTEPTRAQLKDMRIAAEYLSGGTLELIKEILVKHDKSILEEMRIHLKNEYKRGFYDGMEKAKEQSISEPVKERISEPVENLEPVAWETFAEWLNREMPSGTIIGDSGWWASKIYFGFIKNTAPPKREFIELTLDEIAEIFWSMPEGLKGFSVQWGWMQFSDALIASLKEKNA